MDDTAIYCTNVYMLSCSIHIVLKVSSANSESICKAIEFNIIPFTTIAVGDYRVALLSLEPFNARLLVDTKGNKVLALVLAAVVVHILEPDRYSPWQKYFIQGHL